MPLDLQIPHAEQGGHVILARNGAGKSLIASALAAGFQDYRATLRQQQQQQQQNSNDDDESNTYFYQGRMQLSQDQIWHGQAMAHVSFESHEALLAQRDDNRHPLSVQKAIASGGTLSKAAQFLVVRFGMFPLLRRNVDTLSTGEIRKVLIIRALAHRPRLLVLDNAFDGLDVPSREALKELITKTLLGFRPDILVQGVDAKATAHTQVVLMTHRSEEIVDPIARLTYYSDNNHDTGDTGKGTWITEDRQGRTGEALLHHALGLNERQQRELAHDACTFSTDSYVTLPSMSTVRGWWNKGRSLSSSDEENALQQAPLAQATNLHVQRGDSLLLTALDWTVEPGQHWWIAGGNGVGKSTLSRLLAREESGLNEGYLRISDSVVAATTSKTASDEDDKQLTQLGNRRPFVGWVSTESHMALARSHQTTRQVLLQHSPQHAETSIEIATTVLEWIMDYDNKRETSLSSFLERPFAKLSQGEQKLVLIAAALGSRPRLLVLDEPCQGLDILHRQRVLGLIERILASFCHQDKESGASDNSGTDNPVTTLIYITHHPEEVMPSIGHVLHLAKEGKVVYQGSRLDYDPDAVAAGAHSMRAK